VCFTNPLRWVPVSIWGVAVFPLRDSRIAGAMAKKVVGGTPPPKTRELGRFGRMAFAALCRYLLFVYKNWTWE